MSRRDNLFPLKMFIQEEMALGLSQTLMDSIALLPSVTRLRLLAFMHFVNEPKSLSAELDFTASGELRLTLIAQQPSEPSSGH